MRKIKTVLNTTVFDVINCISNLYGDESDGWYIEIKVTNIRDKDIKDILTRLSKPQNDYTSAFLKYDWSLGDMKKELITEKYLNMYAERVDVLGKNIVIYAYEKQK